MNLQSRRFATLLPRGSLIGFALAVAAVVLIALASYRSLVNNMSAATRLAETLEVMEQLEAVLSTVKDAETGQRGFLLTGEESYLAPFVNARAALTGEFRTLRALTSGNSRQQQQLDAIESLAVEKLAELAETIEMRRAGNAAGALAIVRSGRGKAAMDNIRAQLNAFKNEQRLEVTQRQTALLDAARWSYITTGGGLGLLLLLIAIAAVLASREHRAQGTENWLRAGLAEFRVRLQGDQRLDVLGRNALDFLCAYLGAPVGALYIAEPGAGGWRRFASHALSEGDAAPVLRAGDGLLGQALQENRSVHVRDVPAGYLPVSSALGSAEPNELLIAPAAVDGVVFAAVELGFFSAVGAADRELLARVSESLGIAVRSAQDRSQLEDLLEETQRQAEELQTQQEELRVNNEELEEQSRALKESQARMETQQAELEQINSQLEEQAQLLEHQKDELATSQAVLTDKAAELLRSNQYKSEFLANMSHELRTPLNSTLILAKLLADNAAGNLSAEQVKYAQTISSAGNDLLALINDILDLSKIEAGKIDVVSERVAIAATVDALRATFEPLVRQKGLAFETAIDAGTPAQIETDGQRLGQILKNLVSNAAKFTERGHVAVRVFAPQPGHVAFAVRDTGIGIDRAQHETVFEAFRQADGSTHRKFGGTGLGLSISRDLARLLGGDIAIESAPGEGSLFTLTLPVKPAVQDAGASPSDVPPAVPAATRAAVAAPVGWGAAGSAPAPLSPPPLEDDRDHWIPNARSLLVIEDDLRFAAILRDLAREMGFQCVLAHSANDGLAAARTLRPSAILLDMRLPDHSGLGVLDQLKRDPATRHIPVHVASVEDHRHEAFERGAVGYAIKPVQRQELVEALQRLEAKFTAGLKRVLVVEDDARQRDSIRLLLAHGEVQITDADTAAEALAQLQTTTFDCMVMDLNLPDLSGYELLERMAQQHDVAFPPVIVYTGRSLTRDEEQQLRRYSKSIIVKDARSPERLLDEVTLFLHQVESVLPAESQRLLKAARARDTALEGRRILIVEDDVRNIFALSSVLEGKGAKIEIARNGREALDALDRAKGSAGTALAPAIDMVLMDIMMPEMDGFTAMREIRQRAEWKKLPIIALTAKAMRNDQEECLAAGANDYIAKPLDVEKLLSLIRVWMPK